ncbi:hypothetical protein C8Q78DRAFT_1049219 [Trametes maxima]|nr:hypothetical protein C8Q78DRAFT_1049219 [Trametes maxima]
MYSSIHSLSLTLPHKYIDMLSRFDSGASVGGKSQANIATPSALRRRLSRNGTEYLSEAYNHFSSISPTSGPRTEPVISQIVEELDPYRRAYEDDETSEISGWSEDEPSTPPAAAYRALSANPRSPERLTPHTPRYRQPSLDRFPSLPPWSELEHAPLPTFASTISTPSRRTPALQAPQFLDSPMEVEEGEEVAPLRLDDLIYVNGPVPAAASASLRGHTPGLRGAATTPASPFASTRRGASASHIGGEPSSSPVRRSRRVDEKVKGLLADGKKPHGIYRPSDPHTPRRTRGYCA